MYSAHVMLGNSQITLMNNINCDHLCEQSTTQQFLSITHTEKHTQRNSNVIFSITLTLNHFILTHTETLNHNLFCNTYTLNFVIPILSKLLYLNNCIYIVIVY